MTNHPPKTAIRGERITELRKAQKLKQKELATMMGVTPQAVNYWERKHGIEATKLAQLAEILGTTMSYIMGVQPEDASSPNKSVARIDNNMRRHVPLYSLGHMSGAKMAKSREQLFADGETVITNFPASEKALAFTVLGLSMSPEYSDGDIVTIEPEIGLEPGDHIVALIKDKNEEVFREFRFEGADYYLLAPLHPHYQLLRFTHDEWARNVEVIGVVVAHERWRKRGASDSRKK